MAEEEAEEILKEENIMDSINILFLVKQKQNKNVFKIFLENKTSL